ncbi:two-component system, chemotaxis family, response regulator CheY [Salinihabitans flavidus]|uniref:Two-component system, chemotaxis family, response regulator CheY n=1 Tax=Salinihabitans flavidus TaxID=569882 RepID=A0A1H8QKE0_9RHOB|nr:response regulator [Salinihabitans flavidus]SEO54374.1 two-component system, chemotaxis family, response regulator CheY [Salinihabitans flavidus]
MRQKILAVDDSRTMRGMLEQALTTAGYDVELAEDGKQGLEKLENDKPDLAITDINMPRLDGFGFIEGVRNQPFLRGLPILVLTTESAPELKERARSAGATGWIVKPFDEVKLVAAIRRVLA